MGSVKMVGCQLMLFVTITKVNAMKGGDVQMKMLQIN
jgi:hypothetical protein